MPEPDIAILDEALSYSGITLFALIAILAFRDGRQLLQGRLLVLLAICLIGLGLTAIPTANQLPRHVSCIARFVGLPNVGLIWWFSLSLLRDEFRLDRTAWLGMLILSIAPLAYFAENIGWAVPFSNIIDTFGSIAPFAMISHVFWVALSEWSDDLVEPRRRARLWIVLAVMASSVVSMLSEYIANPLHASLTRQLGIVPVQLALLLWLVRLHSEQLRFARAPLTTPPVSEINPKDASLFRKLMTAMETDRVYLQHGLTIESLARFLGAPTHQLRHLINSGLGFRNFATFLGQYRLAHAKAALADPNQARETILVVSYGAGFASLQTFNRVFKDVEGVTPTDFRASALARVSQI